MYKIIFYTDKNGKSEIYEFMKELKNRTKDTRIKLNKITAYINQLSKKGLLLGEPYIKHINNEIWELRPLRYRILFAYYKNNEFLLLNMFIKQTNKTPIREINKAKRMLEEYRKRGR